MKETKSISLRNENTHTCIIAAILFFSALAIRMTFISQGPFHMDVLELARNAEQTLATKTLHYQHIPGYPLAVLIASFFVGVTRWLFGSSDPIFSVNYMSTFFGSLSIVVFYLFALRFFDRLSALFSALIWIFLPLHIAVSTIGFIHMPALFFYLCGAYVFLIYCDDQRFYLLLISAILFGLALAVRIQDVVLLSAFVYLYWAYVWSGKFSFSLRNAITRFLGFMVLIAITTIIFYLPLLYRCVLNKSFDYFSGGFIQYLPSLFPMTAGMIITIMTPLGILCALVGLIRLFFRNQRIFIYFFLIWFFSNYLYYGSLNSSEERFFLIGTVPVVCWIGYFLSSTKKVNQWIAIIFLVVLTFVPFALFLPTLHYRHTHSLVRDFGLFVKQHTEQDAVIIAIDTGPFIEYYGKRKVLYRPARASREEYEHFFVGVDKLLDEHIPVYIITSGINAYDKQGYFSTILKGKYISFLQGVCVEEDWHAKLMRPYFYKEYLFKITRRNNIMNTLR